MNVTLNFIICIKMYPVRYLNDGRHLAQTVRQLLQLANAPSNSDRQLLAAGWASTSLSPHHVMAAELFVAYYSGGPLTGGIELLKGWPSYCLLAPRTRAFP